MNFIPFLILIVSSCNLVCYGFSIEDIKKLGNDKEVNIQYISKSEVKKYREEQFQTSFSKKLENVFYDSTLRFIDRFNIICEFQIILQFRGALLQNNISNDSTDIRRYLKILRVNNSIDNILYRTLDGINDDLEAFAEIDKKANRPTWSFDKKDQALEQIYSSFAQFPNEVNRCAYNEFYLLKEEVAKKHKSKEMSLKKNLRVVVKYNKGALKQKIIDRQTSRKINYLATKSDLIKRRVSLKKYFEITFQAKNKLKSNLSNYEIKDIQEEYSFAAEKLRRFSSITRRENFYQKYSPTQIIILARIFEKASIRMGVDLEVVSDAPTITQNFRRVLSSGEVESYSESYVLDSASQYNYARRMMRKDILEVQAMDLFNKKDIHYHDVVMAAFETGYITIEDIAVAVKHDDLWNPSISRKQRISTFIFRVTGYASFFLPPGFNIIVPLALSITEGVISNKLKRGEDYDNPATVIN